MAFIEGLSYAIAPMVLFGSVGLRMNIGYFSMLLWIQLWMPILAVINLFINMSAAGKMAALTSANYNLSSMMGIYQLDMELQQWLSIGGMLAASTQAIALMLIYRGAVTATHFQGRMDGGDYVNEKIATPDVISPATVLNAQPLHQYSPLSAVTLNGIQNDFKVGQDKADTFAADITQTVNDSQGCQAGLAKSLAMDAQSGTRNVASMGV